MFNKFIFNSTETNIVLQVKALPIGIPYERFERLAKAAPRVLPTDLKVIYVCT